MWSRSVRRHFKDCVARQRGPKGQREASVRVRAAMHVGLAGDGEKDGVTRPPSGDIAGFFPSARMRNDAPLSRSSSGRRRRRRNERERGPDDGGREGGGGATDADAPDQLVGTWGRRRGGGCGITAMTMAGAARGRGSSPEGCGRGRPLLVRRKERDAP